MTLSRSPFSLASSSASASSALDAVITRSSASPATLSCNSHLAPRSASMARLEPITLTADAETMDEDESGARKTPPRFRPPEAVVGRGGREAFMFSTSTCGMPRERAGGGGRHARDRSQEAALSPRSVGWLLTASSSSVVSLPELRSRSQTVPNNRSGWHREKRLCARRGGGSNDAIRRN